MTNAIRRIRHERKLTAAELANLLGVTEGTVLRWENGRMRPRRRQAESLARRLKVKVEDLSLDGDDEPDRALRCA